MRYARQHSIQTKAIVKVPALAARQYARAMETALKTHGPEVHLVEIRSFRGDILAGLLKETENGLELVKVFGGDIRGTELVPLPNAVRRLGNCLHMIGKAELQEKLLEEEPEETLGSFAAEGDEALMELDLGEVFEDDDFAGNWDFFSESSSIDDGFELEAGPEDDAESDADADAKVDADGGAEADLDGMSTKELSAWVEKVHGLKLSPKMGRAKLLEKLEKHLGS